MAQDVSQDLALHGLLGGTSGPAPTPEWQRPSEWPVIDNLVTSSDDKFVALVAIPDNVDPSDGQPVAFSFTTAAGPYDVDWGDGNYSWSDSGLAVGHLYDPTNPNLTATSYGYKTAIITVTASAGITDFNLRPTGVDIEFFTVLPGTWNNDAYQGFTWLDMNMRLPNITGTWASRFNNLSNLQKCRIQDGTAPLDVMTDMFRNCYNLKQFIMEADSTIVTDTSSMFNGCSSLTTVPLFDVDVVNSMESMFLNCYSLTTVPLFNTVNVTNTSSMLRGCLSLNTIPVLPLNSVTNIDAMFRECSSLQEIPLLDVSSVDTLDTLTGLFQGCSSLVRIADLSFDNVVGSTDILSRFFVGCNALMELPNISFPLMTTGVNALFWLSTNNSPQNLRRIRFTHLPDALQIWERTEALGPEALNEIFTNLPTASGSKNINVRFSRGRLGCDTTIATAKGWTVTTS